MKTSGYIAGKDEKLALVSALYTLSRFREQNRPQKEELLQDICIQLEVSLSFVQLKDTDYLDIFSRISDEKTKQYFARLLYRMDDLDAEVDAHPDKVKFLTSLLAVL